MSAPVEVIVFPDLSFVMLASAQHTNLRQAAQLGRQLLRHAEPSPPNAETPRGDEPRGAPECPFCGYAPCLCDQQ